MANILSLLRTPAARCFAGICVLLALVPAASAQYGRATVKTTPRATAVLQISPKGSAMLFPICVYLEGKFYDARFYQAKPVPLALYDETVYEALRDGMSAGLFTVHTARRLESTWWGEGDWKPIADTAEGEKPKLQKPGDKADDKSAKKDDKPAKKEDSAKPDDDPDRPVFRKARTAEGQPTQVQASVPQTYANPTPADDDPDRPKLRRGSHPQEKAEAPLAPVTVAALAVPGSRYLVAISDPDPMELRPFDYAWSTAERDRMTAQISTAAMAELKKWAATNTRTPLAANAQFSDVSLRAVDVDFSNSPYIVFSAQVNPPARTEAERIANPVEPPPFFITRVLRMTMQGELRALLSLPTDGKHIDVNPRMELVDAVDVDGDHRAELIFRKQGDAGRSYVIYRMTPFQMTQIFEGGSGN